MISSVEYGEAAVEVLDIIKYMDEESIQKIPLSIIKKLNERKSENYKSNIDFTKPLEENNLKHTTKVILAMLNRDYLCSEDEKMRINKMFHEAEKKKAEKYDVDVFKSVNDSKGKHLAIIEEKRNIFQKILDKLLGR